MKALALGGVAAPVAFAGAMLASAAFRPGYSHLHQFISELGARGTPHAALMNYAGFVPSGIFVLCLVAAFRVGTPQTRMAGWVAALLAAFGMGLAVAGVASCDPGCPLWSGSLTNRIHNAGSPLAFIAAIGALGISGVLFRRSDRWRSLWRYSLASSLLGAVALALIVASLETRTLIGLWQRLLLFFVFSWCAVVGWRLYRDDLVPR